MERTELAEEANGSPEEIHGTTLIEFQSSLEAPLRGAVIARKQEPGINRETRFRIMRGMREVFVPFHDTGYFGALPQGSSLLRDSGIILNK